MKPSYLIMIERDGRPLTGAMKHRFYDGAARPDRLDQMFMYGCRGQPITVNVTLGLYDRVDNGMTVEYERIGDWHALVEDGWVL